MNYFPQTTTNPHTAVTKTPHRARFVTIILSLTWLLLLPLVWQTAAPAQAAEPAEVLAQGSGDILYVTADGTGTQCTIAAPCYLTTAVGEANTGDEIRVAAGLYDSPHNIGNNDQTLYLNNSLTLRGGFTPADWPTPNPTLNETILDGQNTRRVVRVDGGTILLDGFTIRNGTFDGDGGAGIKATGGNLTIRNSHIHDNTVTGGLFPQLPSPCFHPRPRLIPSLPVRCCA